MSQPEPLYLQAYRQLYKKCLELHGNIPDALDPQKLEFVEDKAIARHFKVKKAFRATGLPVRALYLDENRSRSFLNDCYHPYNLLARRYCDDGERQTLDSAWTRAYAKQSPPFDAETKMELPMMFSFLRPMSTYKHVGRRGATEVPFDMREWLLTSKLRCPLVVQGRRVEVNWTQLAPLPTNGAKNTLLDDSPWRYSRESFLRLDLNVNSDLERAEDLVDTYVFCSQIARLPTGAYVPWSLAEEQRLAREGYLDYNYEGPYIPMSLNLRNVPRTSPPRLDYDFIPPPPVFTPKDRLLVLPPLPPRVREHAEPALSQRDVLAPPFSFASGSNSIPPPPHLKFTPRDGYTLGQPHSAPGNFPPTPRPRAADQSPHCSSLPVGSNPPPPPPFLPSSRKRKSNLAALLNQEEKPSKRSYHHSSFPRANPDQGPSHYSLSHRQQRIYQQDRAFESLSRLI